MNAEQVAAEQKYGPEARAWRERFPQERSRVENELAFFVKVEQLTPDQPVTTFDEVSLWRRWNPNFKFCPQDDCIVRS
jgi:hypothetical protein